MMVYSVIEQDFWYTIDEVYFIIEIDQEYGQASWPLTYVDWLNKECGLALDKAKRVAVENYERIRSEYRRTDCSVLRENPPQHVVDAIEKFRKL